MQTAEAFSAAEPAGAARGGRATNDEIRQVIAAKYLQSVAHDDDQTRSMLATITAAKAAQLLPPASGGFSMAIKRKLLCAVPLIFLASACIAGPCTGEIDRMQVMVDARVEAIAKGGRFGKESVAAQLDRQPTPGSIAAAEAALGEGKTMEQAVEALARAREADRAGDKSACEQALAEAEREISR